MHNRDIFYIERRPREKGRCVIVKHDASGFTDLLPDTHSARSRVHEYGGSSYIVCETGIFFVNDDDQDIYHVTEDDPAPVRITQADDRRFADLIYDDIHHRLIAVCEQHSDDIINSIVAIDIDTGMLTTIVDDADFFASPRPSPSGTHLCWQHWNFPDMPWDANHLDVAALDSDGFIQHRRTVAGGDAISVFQPRWADDDSLFYISDDDGWWHLYRYQLAADRHRQLTTGEREFGLPQWVFGQSSYCLLDTGRILCSYRTAHDDVPGNRLLYIDLQQNDDNDSDPAYSVEVDSPWQEHEQFVSDGDQLALIAASTDCFAQLISARLSVAGADVQLDTDIIKASSRLDVADGYFAQARRIRFENRHGQQVYANYYAPANPDIDTAQITGKPPLIVICHGGPTGQSSAALDARKLYWTSRGFSLLDVDYGGSTGYGRAYRERLQGGWGKLDVEDCCDAASYAVKQDLADAERLIIRGSSAGGLTVLAALAFHDVFAAGACYYGISDLACLADDTHKFESRYTDSLIGPYPEAEALYRERSPIHHAEQLDTPVIFFQGIEDRVVPREQTGMMVTALRQKQVPVAVQYFAGEQHGFRRSSTIEQCLDNELAFYRQVLRLAAPASVSYTGDIELSNMPDQK